MRRVFVTALAAGLVAGLAFFAVQAALLLPLIRAAETYEHAAAQPAHQPEHADAAWEPAEGFERLAFTLLADVVTGVGFALLLAGAFALRGGPMGPWRGLAWGVAGYLAFALAPALVLPPEPPGAIAAGVGLRQAWWLGAAGATAVGLAAFAFAKLPWLRLAGLGLVILPHAFPRLHPVSHAGAAPPELARDFATMSLIATAVFWLVLGAASGWLYPRTR